MSWYKISNESKVDSPSLLVYKDRVAANIQKMIDMAGGPDWLFVHVKTNKTPQIVAMMLDAGISKFKCATIAEAEMVCRAGGKIIVIAHQLVGPKIERLLHLRQQYPDVLIASLIDNPSTAQQTNDFFAQSGLTAPVLLDINNGMNRSGHPLDDLLFDFYTALTQMPYLQCLGLHVYDGHVRDLDFSTRKAKLDNDFEGVGQLLHQIKAAGLPNPMVIAGGTPAFTSHLERVEKVNNLCYSPGTCVLWDWGYGDALQEQPFEYAALVLTRIISKPAEGLITIDMGHKAIAAENAIDKRIKFLNLSDYELIGQSEEHGVLKVNNWNTLQIGDVLYGVPYHVCPTVNLYDEMQVVHDGRVAQTWEVTARKRKITV
ncbi:MAG: D-TA family PLP-dependent enzyme [Runella sp.]